MWLASRVPECVLMFVSDDWKYVPKTARSANSHWITESGQASMLDIYADSQLELHQTGPSSCFPDCIWECESLLELRVHLAEQFQTES